MSAEYAAQKVQQRADHEGEDGLSTDSFAIAKSILLDDDGFWKDLVVCLRVAMPLIKLLRLLDSNKPVIGKVYDRMFQQGEKLKRMKSTGAPWIGDVEKIYAERWEYLHSDFHAAAYALDPEFLEYTNDLDEATQEGLLRVLEKLSLRDAIFCRLTIQSMLQRSLQWRVKRWCSVSPKLSVNSQHTPPKSGPFSRNSVQINAKAMDPASWWAMYGKHLPLLSRYATMVLAQVASASACERNWSVYGRISDKLVYAHEALALHNKLLDAHHQPVIEPWDAASESDSNASTDDDLMLDLPDQELSHLFV